LSLRPGRDKHSGPGMVRPSVERANPFNGHEELMTDPVYLIGNGRSREHFDLERLRGKGTIIGCNALYREFSPDLLIVIDSKLITEVRKSSYEGQTIIPANRSVTIPNAMVWRVDRFNTSGCFGMKMIDTLMRPETCYMLGMDCYAGNVYDGTINYSDNTLQNFAGISSYYLKALNAADGTMFINVNPVDAWDSLAHDSGNYSTMTYDEFETVLG